MPDSALGSSGQTQLKMGGNKMFLIPGLDFKTENGAVGVTYANTAVASTVLVETPVKLNHVNIIECNTDFK